MLIEFTVRCLPVAQPRQRTRIRFAGDKAFGQNYTPAKAPVNAFKASIVQAATEAYSGAPLEGPICLTIRFVMPRPKAMIWKKRAMPRAWHITKPDLDNLEKALKDALKGVTWRDDAQVCRVSKEKVYASGDECPGVEVAIEDIQPPAVISVIATPAPVQELFPQGVES